jgi:hypothetical protein
MCAAVLMSTRGTRARIVYAAAVLSVPSTLLLLVLGWKVSHLSTVSSNASRPFDIPEQLLHPTNNLPYLIFLA